MLAPTDGRWGSTVLGMQQNPGHRHIGIGRRVCKQIFWGGGAVDSLRPEGGTTPRNEISLRATNRLWRNEWGSGQAAQGITGNNPTAGVGRGCNQIHRTSNSARFRLSRWDPGPGEIGYTRSILSR